MEVRGLLVVSLLLVDVSCLCVLCVVCMLCGVCFCVMYMVYVMCVCVCVCYVQYMQVSMHILSSMAAIWTPSRSFYN